MLVKKSFRGEPARFVEVKWLLYENLGLAVQIERQEIADSINCLVREAVNFFLSENLRTVTA
jgi:hypothetical protein